MTWFTLKARRYRTSFHRQPLHGPVRLRHPAPELGHDGVTFLDQTDHFQDRVA